MSVAGGDSHVASLTLSIRTPAAAHHDRVRAPAEAFAVGVLERCDEMLAQRAPGRVVLMKRLDLSLRLIDDALQDSAEIEAFAEAIASGIEAQVATAPSADACGRWTASSSEVATFVDAIDWRATHLEAWSRGSSGADWRFDALEAAGEPLAMLRNAADPRLILDVLVRVHERQLLTAVLAALPHDVIARAAQILGWTAEAAGDSEGNPAIALPDAILALVHRLAVHTSPPSAWLQIAVATREAVGSHDAMATTIQQRAFAAFLASTNARRAIADIQEQPKMWLSAYGGVFYLASLVMDLSLAESLWRVCLPEGAVLSQTVALLLGDHATGDAAAALFGGVRTGDPLPPVAAEPQREVALALFASLVDAIPRRGLGHLGEPVLRLVDAPGGRLLVAVAGHSPYVLFALPAGSPGDIVEALEAFLAIWPASAPRPRSSRALAELDRRGRVLPSKVPTADGEPLVSRHESLATSALLTQAAGTLAHLFAARLDIDSRSSTHEAVLIHLRIPSRIVVNGEQIVVEMPMERLDLDVRRAGLDADPGTIPWLGRAVRFAYIDDAAPGAGADFRG